MEIKGLKFGIMGFARSGIATAQKVLEYGGTPFISEIRSENDILEEVTNLYGVDIWQKLRPYSEFGQHSDKLLDCDMLIVSPGISTNNHIIGKALQKDIKVISEIEFGYLIKDKSSKIIAVTGSNGKSTTVSLIHYILQNAGYKAILAGNIGSPITSYQIDKPGLDYLVLELSSFQLEMTNQFLPDVAVFLNITPDHLDRHSSMENYLQAKLKIFANQTKDERAILNAEDQLIITQTSSIKATKSFFAMHSETIPPDISESTYLDNTDIVWSRVSNGNYQREIFHTQNSHLPGQHNKMNMMAAVTATANIIEDKSLIQSSLDTFLPLPHRLERIAEIKEVVFINDSKATNTESVKYALTAFDRPIHLIAGGYEKGEDYSVLLPYLKEQVKGIYLIGNSKKRMELAFQSLSNKISSHRSMIEAVHNAYNKAQPGDIVLLSPACASFDMYKNYEQRGDMFRTIVKKMEKL